MKYIGNKTRLLPFINDIIEKNQLPKKGTFIDIFSGTTSVAQYFKNKKYKIISNDFMTYSFIYQQVFIKNNKIPKFEILINKEKKISFQNEELFSNNDDNLRYVVKYLNTLKGKKGYFFNNFAPSGKFKRQYFSNKNAMIIDEARDLIEQWFKKKWINENEHYFLICIIIEASDFIANIAGTYGAYLKIWRSMALKKIVFNVPLILDNKLNNKVFNEDSNKLIRKIKGDILYIDPPYNSRQYAPNFHVLETLACWDKLELKGKTGLRPYEKQTSLYSKKDACVETFKDLIQNAKCKYILLSYNNEGIIDSKIILKILKMKGRVKVFSQQYRRFRTERDHDKRKYKVPDDVVSEKLYLVECL